MCNITYRGIRSYWCSDDFSPLNDGSRFDAEFGRGEDKNEKLNWWIPDALRWLVYSYAHYSTERFSSERSLPVDHVTSRLGDEVENSAIRSKGILWKVHDILSQIRLSLVYSLYPPVSLSIYSICNYLGTRKLKSTSHRQIPETDPFNKFRRARNTLRDGSSASATRNYA